MYQHESLTLRKSTNQNKADMDIHVFFAKFLKKIENMWREFSLQNFNCESSRENTQMIYFVTCRVYSLLWSPLVGLKTTAGDAWPEE